MRTVLVCLESDPDTLYHWDLDAPDFREGDRIVKWISGKRHEFAVVEASRLPVEGAESWALTLRLLA